jgi:acyl-CoA thioesterase I
MRTPLKTIGLGLLCLIAVLAAGFGLIVYQIANPNAPEVNARGVRVAVVGDSITYGMGVFFDRDRSSYPAQLQAALGSDYQVLNYGLSARTLLNSGDLPYEQSRFFRLTQQVAPQVALIMLGTNDSKPQNWNAPAFERELTAMTRLYQALPSHPAVYLVTPPATFKNQFHIRDEVIANEIIPIMRRVGERTGSDVIDAYAPTHTHPEYFSDGVHPDARGNRIIAQVIAVALRPLPPLSP